MQPDLAIITLVSHSMTHLQSCSSHPVAQQNYRNMHCVHTVQVVFKFFYPVQDSWPAGEIVLCSTKLLQKGRCLAGRNIFKQP